MPGYTKGGRENRLRLGVCYIDEMLDHGLGGTGVNTMKGQATVIEKKAGEKVGGQKEGIECCTLGERRGLLIRSRRGLNTSSACTEIGRAARRSPAPCETQSRRAWKTQPANGRRRGLDSQRGRRRESQCGICGIFPGPKRPTATPSFASPRSKVLRDRYKQPLGEWRILGLSLRLPRIEVAPNTTQSSRHLPRLRRRQ